MSASRPVRLGIVGACGRGGSFKRVLDAIEGVKVQAVCDIKREELEDARLRLGGEEAYDDYDGMLVHARLDAVLIGTPMPLHVPQAIAALRRGVHVLSEVPAGVSVDECRELVRGKEVDLVTVAAMMGHESLGTMAFYTWPSGENEINAVDKLVE